MAKAKCFRHAPRNNPEHASLRARIRRAAGSLSRSLSCILRLVNFQLDGQYSTRRLCALACYQHKTSQFRSVSILLLSVAPCLTTTTLVDLLRLRPPSDSFEHHRTLIVRVFVSYVGFALLAGRQFHRFVPALPCSRLRLVVSAALVALGCVGAYYLLVQRVGFPLPYTITTVCAVGWAPLMLSLFVLPWARTIRDSESIKRDVVVAFKIWVGQTTMYTMYTLYFYVFLLASASGRVAITFVLPLLKMLARIGFDRALASSQRDETPEVVIFNVDVFSSLFIMYAMQSLSVTTTTIMILLDAIRMVAAIRDFHVARAEIYALQQQIDKEESHSEPPPRIPVHPSIGTSQITTFDHVLQLIERSRRYPRAVVPSIGTSSSILSMAQALCATISRCQLRPREVVPMDAVVYSHSVLRQRTKSPFVHVPVRPLDQTDLSLNCAIPDTCNLHLAPKEERFVAAVRRYLHSMEYVLLVNYVEAIVPLLYSKCFCLLCLCSDCI